MNPVLIKTVIFILQIRVTSADVCAIDWSDTPYSVDENAAINDVIIPDTDVNGNFSEGEASPPYAINNVDPGPSGLFTIDQNSGAIKVGADIDFETHGPIQTVYVNCLQSSGNDGVYAVTINIDDVNESPVCNNLPQTTTISESTAASTSIYRIIPYDQDGDTVSITIASQDPAAPAFSIQNNNEVWTPSEQLNYDDGDTLFSITIRLDDGTSTAVDEDLTVRVVDVIDEIPVFGSSTYDGEVDEGEPIGSAISWTTPTTAPWDNVSDSDAGDVLIYSLSGINSNDFMCNSASGEITTSRQLEADGGSAVTSYSLTITVTDSVMNTATADITITVNDINDNSPVFNPSGYSSSIAENTAPGVTVASLLVSDVDAADSSLTLQIESGDDTTAKFAISGNDVVTSANALDYEDADAVAKDHLYRLKVSAEDGNSNRATATVVVQLLSENEAGPTFSAFPSSPISVSENEPVGYVVATSTGIAASDTDGGTDGQITYSMTVTNGGSSKFHIDSSSGEITTLSEFDYESGTSTYDITVTVKDGGTPTPSSTSSVLTVDIADYNDHAPTFDRSIYETAVDEASNVADAVVTLTATDVDAITTVLTYSIVSGNDDDKFEFHNTISDRIILKSTIDLDSGAADPSEYSLVVEVVDSGTPELTGTATVHIAVTPSNDHSPVFSPTTPTTPTVSENDPVGTSVASINVVDDDFGVQGHVTLTIQGGDTYDYFQLDSSSGVLEMKSAVDFEETGSPVTLTIKATDGGAPPNTATTSVDVIVTDENDNQPTCTKYSYVISMSENAADGDIVVQLDCSDDDAGDTLAYTILSGNSDGNFDISSTGLITLASGHSVDYESAVKSYEMVVQISDGATNVNVQVSVSVSPENDENCYFSPTSWSLNVNENTAAGALIADASTNANDVDAHPHGIVSFDIIGVTPTSGTSLFAIDTITGQIRLMELLDYETQTTFTISVEVRDGSGASDTATIQIDVVDVNDNDPVCVTSSHFVTVNEGTYPFVAVTAATLGCSDADSGVFGTLAYNLVSQTPAFEFTESATTGEVSLAADTLDYDLSHRLYDLVLRVSDGDSPSRTTEVAITIAVNPINDGGPSFATPFTAFVDEDVQIGTSIDQCQATDPDSSDTADGKIVYTITGGDPDGQFIIDSVLGIVENKAPLDYETTTTYTLQITATDGGALTDIQTLTITVNDVNDNFPACNSTTFSLNILETTLPSVVHTLSCEDNDAVDSSLTYTITSGDTSTFDVNSMGELLLQAPGFDFDLGTRFYQLEISVSDLASHAAKVDGVVYVGAVNEAPPVFVPSATYSVTIPEDTAVGATIATVSASDSDSVEYDHGFVTYALAASCNCLEFTIDPVTGDVKLVEALDFESAQSHSIAIEASDSDNTVASSLTLTITDVNDNSPVFNPRTYTASMTEGNPAGGTVVTVTATDGDSTANDNSVIKYDITDGNVGSMFSIDAVSGEITTAAVLDAEVELTYLLVVTAEDLNGIGGGNSDFASVTVQVQPVNEAPPVFQGTPYSTTIPEDTVAGVTIFQAVAMDTDAPNHPHGQVRFAITAGNGVGHFRMDEFTGELITTSSLDRESLGSYILTVTATDSTATLADQLTSTETVTVTVGDVNDNVPKCTPTVLATSIAEGTPVGTTIATLTVSDADDGANGIVDITEDSGDPNNDFDLIGNDVVVGNTLGYHLTNYYEITYNVGDRGTPSLSSLCWVTVIIISENDFPPVFDTALDAVTVAENASPGVKIYTVSAKDDDEGPHGELEYQITDGNTNVAFIIDTDNGDVTLLGELDREMISSYTLEITVFDKGNTPADRLNDTMTLNVVVDDVNDNSPVFTSVLYSVSIEENLPIGSSVEKVKANDADDGNNGLVTYSITHGFGKELFSIQRGNGAINTAADIDREVQALYILRVAASDDGSPPRTSYSVVEITVDDVNDNEPQFQPNNFVTFVSEDSASDDAVMACLATDEDGQNVTHSITNGDLAGQFYIDAYSGEVRVSSVGLDRETTDRYVLEIEGEDTGMPVLTGTATLTITITDVNDNSPVIDPPTYTKNLPEDAVIGTSVLVVEGTDDDLKENARLTYTLTSGNELGHFFIDPVTGLITVVDVLDRESLVSYTMTVTVTDNGNPALDASAPVTIDLSDVNDNVPAFTQITYQFDVVENSAAGTLVGAVQADDPDTGENGRVTYSMVSGQNSHHFNIDADTGEIFAAISTIDRERYDYYTLVYKAKDNGDPKLQSETTVSITVLDDNDNSPVFELEKYYARLTENSPAGTSVLTVSAIDADVGANAGIEYFIPISEVTAVQYFEVDLNTGEITLVAPIDSDTIPFIEFTVYADDTGSPTKRGTVMVRVTNTNVNDNAPVFDPTFYSAELSYLNFLNSPIVTVTATDGDTGQTVSYSLVEGSPFEVDRSTGDIKLSVNGYTAINDKFLLTVEALDDGDPQAKSEVDAMVRVDSFDPYSQLVNFYLSIQEDEFLQSKDRFIDELNKLIRQDYSTGRCGVSHVETRSLNPGSSRRRLLASGDATTVYVYGIKNDVADYFSGTEETKDFVGNSYLLKKFAADTDGTPIYDLQTSPFDEWEIAKVTLHEDTTPTPWYMMWWGILILCLLVALFIVMVILFTVIGCWCCKRHEKKHDNVNANTVDEKRRRMTVDEDYWAFMREGSTPTANNETKTPTRNGGREGWGSNAGKGKNTKANVFRIHTFREGRQQHPQWHRGESVLQEDVL
ncbi:protocadherin Fat 4-like isoform X2 [Ptychodera flava]|uniref:protocadherin Fat 4-like isoform X2 n=1 Tax=Ptychodera flava TaxID=63121 RepID=UPI00396AAE4E